MRLVTVTEDVAPVIKSTLWSPAAIEIQFPSGDTWEYVVYDNITLRRLLYKYRRNVGRLVAELRKLGVEARKLESKPVPELVR